MIPKWFRRRFDETGAMTPLWNQDFYDHVQRFKGGYQLVMRIAWWGYRIGVARERMRATCGNRLTKREYANLAKMAAEGKK